MSGFFKTVGLFLDVAFCLIIYFLISFLRSNENKATKESQGHEEGGKGQKGPKYLLVVRDKHPLVGMPGMKKDPSFLEQVHTAAPPEALS